LGHGGSENKSAPATVLPLSTARGSAAVGTQVGCAIFHVLLLECSIGPLYVRPMRGCRSSPTPANTARMGQCPLLLGQGSAWGLAGHDHGLGVGKCCECCS
jgi:hypothetical protein